MTSAVTLDINDGDIFMDEQTTIRVNVNTLFPDGTPRDITDADIIWVATFNGEQKIRKDMATMDVMLAPQTLTTISTTVSAGHTSVTVANVSGFGRDGWGRPIADFAVGDYVTLTDSSAGAAELAQIQLINTDTLTLVSPTANSYSEGSSLAKIISQFSFMLLPGDTMLPGNKVLGAKAVYDHYGQAVYPTSISPQNINSVPITVTAVRGNIFIDPIPDMSP